MDRVKGKRIFLGFMVFGVLFFVLLSFGLSWAQPPPVLLVVVRASDDSLWKMTCDEVACSPFAWFPGLFRYQPTVTWDEVAQEWVVVGTASDNTIWMATFNQQGNFNDDWQPIPGLTPSPAGASGSFYGVLGKLSCTSGQVPKWSGSAWVCGTDDIGTVVTPSNTVVPLDGGHSAGGSMEYSRGDHKHGIGAGAITTAHILDNTITDADISPSAAIAYSKLSGVASSTHNHDAAYVNEGQANSITSAMIVDGQVGANDLASSAVTKGKLSATGGTSGQMLSTDGTNLVWQSPASAWGLTGNAGTNPSTNFIGTTDNQVLAFRVNNSVAMWIIPHATSPSLIGGYPANSITAGVYGATIGGGGESGYNNHVTDHYGTIGGGVNNQAGNKAGTVSDTKYATVGGGVGNTASGHAATVGGGNGNEASSTGATVGGGYGNKATVADATVGGGYNNTASNGSATVGGGYENTASGDQATVGGGYDNTASGYRSTVPGGSSNGAYGYYSFAAGRRAKAHNQGCFVWADSTDADLNCTNTNRFVARASGGYHLFTNSGMSTSAFLGPGESTWNGSSDRNLKENYLPTDGKKILISLVSIPITTWNYKSQDPSIRHMGPVAQDFSAAFGLGASDKHINTIDLDGVALAAIQGLYQMVKEKEEEIERIARENKELREAIGDINKRLSVMVLPGATFAEK